MIQERIVAAAKDPSVSLESVRIETQEGMSRILAGSTALVTLIDPDAALEQLDRDILAAIHLRRVREAIAAYRDARSPAALRGGAYRAGTATVVLLLAVLLITWMWRRVDRFLAHRLALRIKTVGIQSFEVMRAEQIWSGVRGVLAGTRSFAILICVLVYAGYVLAQFPQTRRFALDAGSLITGPLSIMGAGLLAQIPALVFLVVLYFVVRMILRLMRAFFDAVERGTVALARFESEWAQPTYKILRLVVVAFALIVAYPYIPGSESAAFQGVSLFLGVVFSLGSSTAIANVIAGYMLIYRRAFKVGDRIQIGNNLGDVIETRLQVTHLRTVKNEELIIPNSQILSGEVLNYSSQARTQGVILHTEVGIGYETPWRQVEAMLIQAAERTSGLGTDPRPFVLEKRLADFAVVYELNVYCANVNAMARLYAELHRHILDVFNEYGVQIMTPAYEGDPSIPKVVPAKDWYLAPAVPPTPVSVGQTAPADAR
jgi:small-conductance mechanosensitive channel